MLELREARNDNRDMQEIANRIKNRISGHYIGLARAKFGDAARFPAYFFPNKKLQDAANTCCTLKVYDKFKPDQYPADKPLNIKICERQAEKGNDHAFRVELKPDGSDLYGNNNPKYNVTYLAFVVDNITGGYADEAHIYILDKEDILKVVKDLIDNGAIIYKKNKKDPNKVSLTLNSKVKDQWGNSLNHYKKNIGVLLTNNYIRKNYFERFGLGVGEYSSFKNKVRKLDEVLLAWNNKTDLETNTDTEVISAGSIKDLIDRKSTWYKIGKKFIKNTDLLLYFNPYNWTSYAWVNRYTKCKNIRIYGAAEYGLNFLSWEALKCIDWIEVIAGESGNNIIHIDYPKDVQTIWQTSLEFSVSSPGLCKNVKYSLNTHYEVFDKLWLPFWVYTNPEGDQPEYWMQKIGKSGNIPVFHVNSVSIGTMAGVTAKTAIPRNYWDSEITPAYYRKDLPAIMIRIKFKEDPYNWLTTGAKEWRLVMGQRYISPTYVFLGKSFKKIPDNLFSKWTYLTRIGALNPLNYIAQGAFKETYLCELSVPGTKFKNFEENAFVDINPKKFHNEEYGENGFWIWCNSLKDEYLKDPKTVKKYLCGNQRRLDLKFI